MNDQDINQTNYGTGKKTLTIYLIGFVSCVLLTLIAFWTVMSGNFVKWETFVIIYTAACIQFLVQLVCFLRLNIQTEQGQTNVMSLIFTGVILISIIVGSLWIMWNLNYNMFN